MRTTLVRLAADDHVVPLTLHHIVGDIWSVGVLVSEVAALYRAYTTGADAGLPELPVQYADLAIWQRRWLQGKVLDAQLAYRRKQLEGVPSVMELPADGPRPAVQSLRGASRSFLLPASLAGRLKEISRRENVTLYMILLAAFQTLLYRHTEQEDIIVSTPIAGRNRVEVENLIGFFVNTLVLRTRLSGDLSFGGLLKGVREVTPGAYAHQDVPFEKLVEEFQPERTLAYAPLVQVIFALQNAPQESVEVPGLRLSSPPLYTETAKFDLIFSLVDMPQSLLLSVGYNTDLSQTSTIHRLVRHYETLLGAVAADPDWRLSELSLLTEEERRQLLREWNDTAVEQPRGLCIHELFEGQVERTLDARVSI